MSVTIRIYSRLHDKYDNLYADYSPLFRKLPAIAYYPPEDELVKEVMSHHQSRDI